VHPSLQASLRLFSRLGIVPRPLKSSLVRRTGLKLIGAVALLAGCHSNNNASDYGYAWVTVTADPGPFASYVVNIDSITLTDAAGNVYTALATVEPVDLVKLTNIAELWGTATIPDDTYVKATIVLDYTDAEVSVFVNGQPEKATVVFPTTTTLTTVSIPLNLDPNKSSEPVIAYSFGTYNAIRLALDIDLSASNRIDASTSPVTVTANPFVTLSTAPSDNKPIRIRGPLINSNLSVGTFTVYERPFYDEVNNIGTVSIFNSANTIYTIDGTTYVGGAGVGGAGLNVLSQVSAGVTTTETYAYWYPTKNNDAAAGIFQSLYVVAGDSLETNYTENVTGEVSARNGNTLTLINSTLAGATVALSEGYFEYVDTPTNVIVGPTTVVTAEGNSTLTNLDYNSIAVGQRIAAIGVYSLPANGIPTIDATAPTTGSNTGQIRLLPTQLFGHYTSSGADTLSLSLLAIDGLPVASFEFTGNGGSAATTPSAADYLIDTTHANAALSGLNGLAGAGAGTSLWVNGVTTPFGSAPPDFTAFPNYPADSANLVNPSPSAIHQEAAVPASLEVTWTTAGTTTPFTDLSATATSLTINLQNPALTSAVIRIGPEAVPLATLPASPTIVPNTPDNAVANAVPSCVVAALPSTAQPCQTLFSVGTPNYGISEFVDFGPYVSLLVPGISSAYPATLLSATGFYDRATNTFIANRIDLVN